MKQLFTWLKYQIKYKVLVLLKALVLLLKRCWFQRFNRSAARSGESSQTILFNAQYFWTYSWFDCLIAWLLQQAGYRVRMVVCDGLPFCEQASHNVARPNCRDCFRQTNYYLKAFGLTTLRLSDYLSSQARDEAAQCANTLPIERIRSFSLNGIALGQIAYRDLLRYSKGELPLVGETASLYRQCFHAGLLQYYALNRLFSQLKPSLLVSANGKFVQSAVATELAAQQNIDYITWDVFTQFEACIVGRNAVAHDQSIPDELWQQEKDKALTTEQRGLVDAFFKLQKKSLNTPYRYYTDETIEDDALIFKQLELDAKRPMGCAFANVMWDSTGLGLDGPFEDMVDFFNALIEWAGSMPTVQVVIRAHPGELKVSEFLKTRRGICDILSDAWPTLPDNVRLVTPEQDLSSYTLARLANIAMVYSSTMGLELALMGIKPWVASTGYYRNRGFTFDIENRQHLFDSLCKHYNHPQYLSEDELEFAYRFCYIARFRRLFTFPYFDKTRFTFHSFEDLLTDEIMNKLKQFFERETSCLDIGPLKM